MINTLDGSRFQKELGEFIYANKLQTIVETGYGISSFFICEALEKMCAGKLYSIDPSPWFSEECESPYLERIKEKSQDALLPLYLKTGGWDMMIADGAHDIFWQTLEPDFGFACLRHGGYLAMDDVFWGGNKAWSEFCGRYNLIPFKIGSLEVVQKRTEHYLLPADIAGNYFMKCLLKANEAERIFLLHGGQNTACFPK